jgi:hypothetical protein
VSLGKLVYLTNVDLAAQFQLTAEFARIWAAATRETSR